MKHLMTASLFLVGIFFAEFVLAKTVQKNTKIERKPNQLGEEQGDIALRTPHNCRIVVHYLLHSETEKIEILPYRVKNEAECQQAGAAMKPVLDPQIKTKTVKAIWLGE